MSKKKVLFCEKAKKCLSDKTKNERKISQFWAIKIPSLSSDYVNKKRIWKRKHSENPEGKISKVSKKEKRRFFFIHYFVFHGNFALNIFTTWEKLISVGFRKQLIITSSTIECTCPNNLHETHHSFVEKRQ